MKLGLNLHADWGDLRNIKWLKNNTTIKHIRLDFPCRDYFGNFGMIKHLNSVLDEAKNFETILIHVGYLKSYDFDNYQIFGEYINQITSILKEKRFNHKGILEIWNNVNIADCWLSSKDYSGFKRMLDSIYGELELARKNGIKIAGFSTTLNHQSGWRWLHELREWLKYLDYTTIQIYPEHENQYIELVNRFENEYPELDYIITETGHHGKEGEQLCKYRQLMLEIEIVTPDKLVFLYHLFDWKSECQNRGWELISWEPDNSKPYEKPTSIYLKHSFNLQQLEKDKPRDFYCCSKSIWRKIVCFFRGIF